MGDHQIRRSPSSTIELLITHISTRGLCYYAGKCSRLQIPVTDTSPYVKGIVTKFRFQC